MLNSICAYYTMLIPGRQHALIKKCALISEVHLLTRVYGIEVHVFLQIKGLGEGCWTNSMYTT